MTDVQKTHPEYSHLQECLVRHHEEHEKRSESNALGGVILPVLRRKFQNELEKNSRIRIDCIASTAEIIIPSRLMNYVMVQYKGWHTMIQYKGVTHYDSLQKECHTKKITHEEVTHCLSCGSSTRSILCCRSWIGGRKKNVKKDIKQFSSPTAMQTKQKQLQMSRSPGRWMTKFIEDLN